MKIKKQALIALSLAVVLNASSPLPVEIDASGTWPDLCAQIADVHSKTLILPNFP